MDAFLLKTLKFTHALLSKSLAIVDILKTNILGLALYNYSRSRLLETLWYQSEMCQLTDLLDLYYEKKKWKIRGKFIYVCMYMYITIFNVQWETFKWAAASRKLFFGSTSYDFNKSHFCLALKSWRLDIFRFRFL